MREDIDNIDVVALLQKHEELRMFSVSVVVVSRVLISRRGKIHQGEEILF